MIYTSEFSYTPSLKSLEDAPAVEKGEAFGDAVIGFIHVEEKDEDNPKSVERNLVNNLKWAARKNETKNIVIHSFAHLSESKANPEFTLTFLNKVEQRIANAGYQVAQTPWGYFLDLEIKAPGKSLARVFKSF